MMRDGDVVARVASHYARHALAARLDAALDAAGLHGRRLTPRDLAPIDQFHIGGLRATIDLAAALEPARGASVVDVGCGLGGAARYLATTFDCQVRGIDLSPSFVEAATLLTERSDLSGAVRFDVGNALALPYPDRHFDAAWTQHAAMNIRDRSGLYSEVFRVLRSGSRFAISDVLAGTGALHFPVPWAADEHTSFLMTPTALRELLEAVGFRVRSWIDRTAAGLAWLVEQSAAAADATAPPRPSAPATPLNLGVVMGPEFGATLAILVQNLREARVAVAEIVLEKP